MEELQYWLKGEEEQNLGDFLAEYLSQHLFIRTSRRGADVRIVGSALADFVVPPAPATEPGATPSSQPNLPSRTLIAWGLGVRHEGSLSQEAQSRVEITAVRGPISASELKLGLHVPLGDPGLLMPALYTPRVDQKTAGKTLCVPHFHDRRTDESLIDASGCNLVLRTSIRRDLHEIELFIDSLTSADFVLCGSLHAAVFAAAYGVPFAYWDSGDIDLPLKWKDFSQSIGIPANFVRTVEEGKTEYTTHVHGQITLPSLTRLLASAPYIIRLDVLLKIVRYGFEKQPTDKRIMDRLGDIIGEFEDSVEHFQKIADEVELTNAQLGVDAVARAKELEETQQALDLARTQAKVETTRHTQIVSEMTIKLEELERDRQHHVDVEGAVVSLQEKLHSLQQLHDATITSLSWRITAGLRKFVAKHHLTWKKLKRAIVVLRSPSRLHYPGIKAEIVSSRLFDAEWYRESNPDIRNSNVDPLEHYVFHGAVEGRSPRRLFDVEYYLSQTDSSSVARKNPLLHYIRLGQRSGLKYSRIISDISALQFREEMAPKVSIIIPCYGQVDFTAQCLLSIFESKIKASYEILVVEDASGDPDAQKLRDVKNINYIQREKNLGFLRSCNEATKHARGEYIFLLNNDTQVLPGAIDELVETFSSWPDKVGMTGSRLLYPDGVLQEAGGIIWKDGSADNYGKYNDPNKHQYTYNRRADYISGAAIMIPTALWVEMGGFDEYYLPAYCEDSDLAFRIRQAGYEVVYVATSSVVHFEGVSHGRDINKGIKAHQVENSRRLKERWQEVLSSGHGEHGDVSIRTRDRAGDRKITLVIDHYVPEPDRDAGSRTMVSFIDRLLESGRIVKFWPDNRFRSGYTEQLLRKGVEVIYGPWIQSFEEWIRDNGNQIDEVLLSRPQIAPRYINLLNRYSRAKLVYYGHDLHHARMALEAQTTGDPVKMAEAEEMREQEQSVWKRVDVVLYPSQDEVDAVLKLEPEVDARSVSPYAFDISETDETDVAGRKGIIFVAGFAHSPNVNAAQWFCNEVLPLVQLQIPRIKLSLVGSNPTAAVRALASRDVEVTGFVSDLELSRRYDQARVAVAPLQYGAGVKLKVVEALKEGVPLVTTPVGAQGLGDLEGICDVTDQAEAFAQAVVALLTDDALWSSRSRNQRGYVQQHFSKSRMSKDLEAAFVAE